MRVLLLGALVVTACVRTEPTPAQVCAREVSQRLDTLLARSGQVLYTQYEAELTHCFGGH